VISQGPKRPGDRSSTGAGEHAIQVLSPAGGEINHSLVDAEDDLRIGHMSTEKCGCQ